MILIPLTTLFQQKLWPLQICASEISGFSFSLCISFKYRLVQLYRIIALKGKRKKKKKTVIEIAVISKIPEKGEKQDYFNSFFILVLAVSLEQTFMEIKSRLSQTSCFLCNILSFFGLCTAE